MKGTGPESGRKSLQAYLSVFSAEKALSSFICFSRGREHVVVTGKKNGRG